MAEWSHPSNDDTLRRQFTMLKLQALVFGRGFESRFDQSHFFFFDQSPPPYPFFGSRGVGLGGAFFVA